MANDIFSQPTDPQALALTHAIALAESGSNGTPNYNAVGDNGTSFGAYQWNGAGHFASDAKSAGLNPNDFSPENQDKVAYAKIKGWKDQGLTPAEIASKWNSGQPNNYQNHSGVTNINGKLIHYDTPAYVQKVHKFYNQLNGQNGLGGLFTGAPYNNNNGAGLGSLPTADKFLSTLPKVQLSPEQEQAMQPESFGQKVGNVAKGIVNFAFPIIGDVVKDLKGKSDKRGLQQLGDLGMSALWFLPFGDIAEGAGMGLKALGLGEDIARVGGVLATGAGAGYAGDVASHLAQGQQGGQVFKPGVGTVLGGGLAGATLAGAGLYNKFLDQQSAVNKIEQAYMDAAGATKVGIKGMSKTATRGLQSNPEFLANAGILPETEEINGRRVFRTGPDSQSQQILNERINNLTDLRDKAIDSAGTKNVDGLTYVSEPNNSLAQFKQEALQRANSEFSGTARDTALNHINTEFDSYAQQFSPDGENVSLRDLNTIKKDLQGKTNYDATRPSIITQVNKLMANVVKRGVEDNASNAGVPGIDAINKVIQQHLDAMKFLDKINGQTVKGGRLGGYAARTAGAIIGSSVPGGGIISHILGGIGGEEAGNLVSRFMQKLAAGGSVSAAIIGRMAKYEPEAVSQLLKQLGENGEVASMLQPAQKNAGGLVGELLQNYSPYSLTNKAIQRIR